MITLSPNKMGALLLLSILCSLSACVSGPKRLASLEAAIQNPEQLNILCRDGVTGACALRGEFRGVVHELSIMQGVSGAHQSRFTVVIPKREQLIYFARGPQSVTKLDSQRVERANSPMAVDQVEAFGLNPGVNYELIVINNRGDVWERRNFRALDPGKAPAKIAVISCLDDALKAEAHEMWPQLLAEKPDVLLMIGDNVYADRGGAGALSADQLWERYVDTRQSLDFYKTRDLVPTFATWDDHDYGKNDGDRTNPLKEESTRIFQAFFAQDKPAGDFTRGPGVASWWSAYGVQFGLLDDRSFRSPNKTDLPDQTHFGVAQEDWIWDHLKDSAQPTFLLSGDQWFGGYHPFESYEGSHPQSFARQLAVWKKAKAPIIFVSGDRHLTEIIRVPRQNLGYATYEITSSALHSKSYADAFEKNPSPFQLVGVAGKPNYALFEIRQANSRTLQVRVMSKGPAQQILFDKTLTVKK